MYQKFTEEEIQILKDMGENDDEIRQCEEFMNHMTYNINGIRRDLTYTKSQMDLQEFLSGVDRATFHHTAQRGTKDGKPVYFDASDYWNFLGTVDEGEYVKSQMTDYMDTLEQKEGK